MKLLPVLIALIWTSVAFAQETVAKPGGTAPSLSAEEQSKVLFSATGAPNNSPPQMFCRVYNGLKDRHIIGLVVIASTVISEKEKLETEIYVPIAVDPLATVDGSASYYLPMGSNAKTEFTLKEVKYTDSTSSSPVQRRRLVPAGTPPQASPNN